MAEKLLIKLKKRPGNILEAVSERAGAVVGVSVLRVTTAVKSSVGVFLHGKKTAQPAVINGVASGQRKASSQDVKTKNPEKIKTKSKTKKKVTKRTASGQRKTSSQDVKTENSEKIKTKSRTKKKG